MSSFLDWLFGEPEEPSSLPVQGEDKEDEDEEEEEEEEKEEEEDKEPTSLPTVEFP